MAKLNLNFIGDNQSGTPTMAGDKILSMLHTGIEIIQDLADTRNSMISASNSKKAVETDNAVKLINAQNDTQKETNRHNEELAKIEIEWKKITNDKENQEKRLSLIQEQIQRFQAEYDKYMSLESEEFMNETTTIRLESLRKIILDLTKELNHI